MLGNLLKRKNIASVMTADGRQAVDYLKNDLEACNIVFMDNLMPVLSGVDATRELRAAGYRHLIIGCTGNVMEEDTEEYLEAGADMILAKPMRINQLDLLIVHINSHGSLSIPNMKLKEVNNKLTWIPFDKR